MTTAEQLIKQGKTIGFKEGEKKGKDIGLKEEKIKTAKKMLKKQYPLKEVMEITGLSRNELKKAGLISLEK